MRPPFRVPARGEDGRPARPACLRSALALPLAGRISGPRPAWPPRGAAPATPGVPAETGPYAQIEVPHEDARNRRDGCGRPRLPVVRGGRLGPLVDAAALQAGLASDPPLVLDTRGATYDEGHIPGAVSTPYAEFRGPPDIPARSCRKTGTKRRSGRSASPSTGRSSWCTKATPTATSTSPRGSSGR